MKLAYKLVFLLLVGALVAPLWLKGPDGRPLMSWRDWLPDQQSLQINWPDLRWPAWLGGPEPSSDRAEGRRQQFYKWQDAQGTWHLSTEPNPDGPSEPVWVDLDANRIELPKPQLRPQPSAGQPQAVPLPTPTTLPLDQIPALIEDAKHVQSLSDERARTLEKF